TMKTLGLYSEEALRLAELSPAARVADVACGPGTLSLMAAPRAAEVWALDFSKKMLANFRRRIEIDKINNIRVFHGDGQALPFPDGYFEAAFSMFGLMF